MTSTTTFNTGDTVKLSMRCPIDFEGVGPTAHELGRVVTAPENSRRHGCLAVRFERSAVPWLIPFKYLERVQLHGSQ